jgi:hypothetical protein
MTPTTGSTTSIDLDKLMLDKNERSIFEREAMHWLDGTHPLITAAGFRLNDDGTYWSSATRRLFGFWQAARRATPQHSGTEQASIGGDPEFNRLHGAWMQSFEYYSDDEHESVRRDWVALIAYIDSRAALATPASTAASEQQASGSDEEALHRQIIGDTNATLQEQSATMLAQRKKIQKLEAALSGRATIPSEADERARFEAWAKPQSYWWNGQTYSDLHTQIAWEAWRAALTHRATTAGQQATSAPAANAAVQAQVDWIGLALDLEQQAKRVESQTTERAMLAAAHGLRLIGPAYSLPSVPVIKYNMMKTAYETELAGLRAKLGNQAAKPLNESAEFDKAFPPATTDMPCDEYDALVELRRQQWPVWQARANLASKAAATSADGQGGAA